MIYHVWGQRYRFFRIDLNDPFCQAKTLENLLFQELEEDLRDAGQSLIFCVKTLDSQNSYYF